MAEITTLFNNYQVPFPTVETLPANDVSRAGACFFYEGELYGYGSDGVPVAINRQSVIPLSFFNPPVDESKAGTFFWFNNQLWTYAQTNQFGSVPVGTPWPAKGYKEFNAFFLFNGTNISNLLIKDNTLGYTITPSYVSTGRIELSVSEIAAPDNNALYGLKYNIPFTGNITDVRIANSAPIPFIINTVNSSNELANPTEIIRIWFEYRLYPTP
jgi:hypothetical protein